MAKRMGTLLEKDLLRIFNLIGFDAEHSKIIKGYEIDVFAEDKKDNLSIVIQCKQYERSQLNVRDLIHQWSGKNKIIGADKVLIAIYGVDVSEKDKQLAREVGMSIWDEEDIESYFNLATEKKQEARKIILKDLEIEKQGTKINLNNLKKVYITPKIELKSIIDNLKKRGFDTKLIGIKEILVPYLDTKIKVESDRSFNNFKYKNEIGNFFCDMSSNNIKLDKDLFSNLKLNEEIPKTAKELKIKINIIEVVKNLRKLATTKKLFYYSSLQSEFEELKGIYRTDKNALKEIILECYSEETEEELDKINNKFEPDISKIQDFIDKLKHDIGLYEEYIVELEEEQDYATTDRSLNSISRKTQNTEFKINQKKSKIKFYNIKLKELQNRLDSEIEKINDKYNDLAEESILEYEFIPKEDEILLYDSKILLNPIIGALLRISKGKSEIKTDIILKHNGIEQLGQCIECKGKIDTLEDFYICSNCLNILCEKHKLICDKCKNTFCKKDIWECNICNKKYCNKERKIKCNTCHKNVNPECSDICSKCKKPFCNNHIIDCHCCKNKLCNNHYTDCRICKKKTCSECIKKCSGCNKEACKKDFLKCKFCNKTICKDCIRYKKTFILKEPRCTFCLDKKDTRPVKDKIIKFFDRY